MKEIKGLKDFEYMLNQKQKAVVKFWAPWCGPCRMLKPIYESASNKVKVINFYTLNIDDSDENKEIAKKYNVGSIPTLLIFENKNILKQKQGFMQLEKMIDFLES